MISTVEAIAQGKIVGWFQGRMEFGPRALGNRSILADPRRKDMKEILNSRIKYREPFRPFCPSILCGEGGRIFRDGLPVAIHGNGVQDQAKAARDGFRR